MSKSAFAQKIISELKGAIGKDGQKYTESSATSAMAAVAKAITDYLIANTKVTIAYSGTIPGTPPSPDPTVSDVFEIVGSCAPPSPSDSFDSWIKEIEANIIAGFKLAAAGKAKVVFAQTPFAITGITTVQSMLKSNHDVSDEDPQQKIWEIVCGGIMDWINGTAMNTTPGGATHPPAGSSGTANITKITIS